WLSQPSVHQIAPVLVTRFGSGSTPQRVSKNPACFGHPPRFELHDTASECLTWDGVEVVEIHDTLRGNAIILWIQLQLRNKTPTGSSQCGHHHRANPAGNGVPSQYQYRPVTA